MEVGDSTSSSDPASAYFLALSLAVAAVGLSVTGIILLVTCETTQFVSQFGNSTIGCRYPFQPYGLAFLYAASLVLALEAFPIHRVLRTKEPAPNWSPGFLSLVAAGGATFLFLVVYFLS